MSTQKPIIPNYFGVQDGEPARIERKGVSSNPLGHRRRAHARYGQALEGLTKHVDNFEYFNDCGLLDEWTRINTNRFGDALAARHEFYHHIATITGSLDAINLETPVQRDRYGYPVTTPTAAIDRLPDETADEHELRVFRDFGIRVPATKPDPGAIIFPPDPTVELLTGIRELLAQLVANQARTAPVNIDNLTTVLGKNSSVLSEDPAKLRESLKGYKRTVRTAVAPESAPDTATKAEPPAPTNNAEIVLANEPDIGVGISNIEGRTRVTIRLQDRTALVHADTAFTLANQLERTAKALCDGWIPPTPASDTATTGGEA